MPRRTLLKLALSLARLLKITLYYWYNCYIQQDKGVSFLIKIIKHCLTNPWILLSLLIIWCFILYPLYRFLKMKRSYNHLIDQYDTVMNFISKIDDKFQSIQKMIDDKFPDYTNHEDCTCSRTFYPAKERKAIEYIQKNVALQELQQLMIEFALHAENILGYQLVERFNSGNIKDLYFKYIPIRNDMIFERRRIEIKVQNTDFLELYFTTIKNKFFKPTSVIKRLFSYLIGKIKTLLKIFIVVLLVSTLL